MSIWDKWSKEEKVKAFLELGSQLEKSDREEVILDTVEPITINDSYTTHLERIKNGIVGIKTGFADLDDSLAGLQKGSVYVLGGYTGTGKTLLTCNIVLNIALDARPILFLTTEMPDHEVTGRLRKLWDSYLADDDNFRHLPINYIDNKWDITTGLVRHLLTKNQHEATEGISNKFELLVIDNLQWFSRGGANIAESTGLATQAIKKMAIEFDIPVILVSHLSRLAMKQESPDLDSLKNSSYIEQDADAVIMISRDVDGKEYSKDGMLVSIRKNRLTGELRNFILLSDNNLVLRKASLADVSK